MTQAISAFTLDSVQVATPPDIAAIFEADATLAFLASDAWSAQMDRLDRQFIALCAGRLDRSAAPWVTEEEADDAARVICTYPQIVWG